MSGNRNTRPHDAKPTQSSETPFGVRKYCPFCEGNEAETPSERDAFVRSRLEERPEEKTLDRYRRPNSPGWQVRSVPNRYPFVSPDLEPTSRHVGPYLESPNIGIQEVLVDVPHHVERLGDLSPEECQYLVYFYHRRMHQLRKEKRWKYVQLFKNQGVEAGASIAHLHSQIVGLPFVPTSIELEQKFLQEYYNDKGRCYHCMILDYERQEKIRMVVETEFFSVFCPFASMFPFEMYILPRRHNPCFVHSTRGELDDLSELLRRLAHCLEQILSVPSYNLVLRNSPWSYETRTVQEDEYFHWRLEILPRTTKMAGYEFGTGYYVNPTPPEQAAEILRQELDSPSQ